MSPTRIDIMRLSLVGAASRAAQAIAREHPGVEFTSGHRNLDAQCRAMADNVVLATKKSPEHGRRWIFLTYKQSVARDVCQQWLDEHPDADTVEAIEKGLLSVLEQLEPFELEQLSKHLVGKAFDIKPTNDVDLKTAIRRTVERFGGRFLDKEGGLVKWHAQF